MNITPLLTRISKYLWVVRTGRICVPGHEFSASQLSPLLGFLDPACTLPVGLVTRPDFLGGQGRRCELFPGDKSSTMTVYHDKPGIPTNHPPTNRNPASCTSGRPVTTNIPQSCTTWTANSMIIFILFMHTLQSLGNQPFSTTTLTQTPHRPVPLLFQSQGIRQLSSLPTHGIH